MGRFVKMLAAGALVLAIVLVGCAGQKQDPEPATDPVAGGWEVAGEAGSSISDDERAIFEKATENLMGVDHEPVAVIATQIVAGANRAYLCKGTVVSPDSGIGWHVITIYEDLEGGAELLDIKELDITQPILLEGSADAEMVGAWMAAKPGSAALPTEVDELFAKAMEDIEGMSYKPIALLGTQLVSGTNYLVLCYGEPVVPNARGALYLVQFYVDLDGGAEITSIGQLDLLSYI